MKRTSVTLNLKIFILFFNVFFFGLFEVSPVRAAVNQNVLPAIVQDSDWFNTSRALKVGDLQGRIILLDFWTYCCINCIHVIPDLKALEDQFKDKLTVIGVHSAKFLNEKDGDNIRNAILRYGLEHPVVNDASFNIWNAFKVRSWPTFILVNPQGRVVLKLEGEGQKERLRQAIDDLIDKATTNQLTTYKNTVTNSASDKSLAQSLKVNPLPLKLEKDKAPITELRFPGKVIFVENFQGRPVLFISDSSNNRILGVELNGEIIVEVGRKGAEGAVDGDFGKARFNKPQGLFYKDELLYVADTGNHELRLVDLKNKKVTTLAGTGREGTSQLAKKAEALKTDLNSPWDITLFDGALAIAMAGDHQIWSYSFKNKTLSTLAGHGNENIRDGEFPNNSLAQTSGLSAMGATLFFVDAETSSLRKLEGSKVTTLIGSGLFDFGFQDGKLGQALLQHPLGLTARPGAIFIADAYNHAIRKYDLKTDLLTTITGGHGYVDGPFGEAKFNEPNGITFEKRDDEKTQVAYVTDTNNHVIRRLDFNNSRVTTLNVHEKGKVTAPEISESLPNVKKHEVISVSEQKPVKVNIKLDAKWHINDQAPSAAWLFDISNQKPVFVESFSQKQIASLEFQLPPLKFKKTYRFQGIFYYCENKEGSACLIQSHDQVIKVSDLLKKDQPVSLVFELETQH